MTKDRKYEVFSKFIYSKNISNIDIRNTEMHESTGLIFDTLDQANQFVKFRQNSLIRTKISQESQLTDKQIREKLTATSSEINSNFDKI